LTNSKLILILKTLTNKEFKELELYVSSPLFNKNQDVINLLSILKPYYPSFSNKKISHETISKKLFGKIEVKRIRYTMTDLTKLSENFIAFLIYNKNNHNHLLKAYQKRGLDKYFNQELTKKHESQVESSEIRDEKFYQDQQELSEISFLHTLESDNRNIDTKLQDLVDNLDLYYLSKKLKYSCEIINRMNILNVEYDINLLNNLTEYISQNEVKNTPSITVYHQVLKTLKSPEDEKNYIQLKELVKTHLHRFKKEEQYDLYGYLQNYCIKKINSGNSGYLLELFENYSEMLEDEVVIKNNSIAQFDFKNMVTVALRVQKYDWTERFIENYQNYLPDDHRTNAINYNKARLAFYQENYKTCLRELLSVEFTDIYYSLDSRALLLKTYYELENFESATNLISSFKIFLKRDRKISEYQNSTYSSFVKIAHQLIQFKLGYKKDIDKIETELNNISQVADSTWLRDKIDNIKSSQEI
jgi:hypothetical protein